MFNDLREFMEALRGRGLLKNVSREIELKFELGAVVRKAADVKGPALLFTNLKSHSWPVLANLFGTYERVAEVFGTDIRNLNYTVMDKIREYPVWPREVETGPVKEVVIKGADVDLTSLPIPVWNGLDQAPFITWGIQISRSPETKVVNAGVYRMQVHNEREMGILAPAPKDLGWHLAAAEKRDEPLEVAVVVGCDPFLILAACSQTPYGWDELALAGAFRGSPVDVVPCETLSSLMVPAAAELVIEGRIIPGLRRVEGPFGEVTGFMGGAAPRPVFEVSAITHRKDPIFLGAYTGRPVSENQVMVSFSRTAFLLQMLRELSPNVLDCCVIPESSDMHCAIKIKKSFDGPSAEEAKRLAFQAFSYSYQLKRCVVVDDDIDIYDLRAIQYAISTRVRPGKDIIVVPEFPNHILDPAYKEKGIGAKYLVDATVKYRTFPAVASPVRPE